MKKEGIKSYYQAKIEECELVMNEKSQDLRRLEAQRNALNAKGKTISKQKKKKTSNNLNQLSPCDSSSLERRTSVIARTWILCW
jgi:hypothetical protein